MVRELWLEREKLPCAKERKRALALARARPEDGWIGEPFAESVGAPPVICRLRTPITKA